MVWYSLRKLLQESRGTYPSPLVHRLVRDGKSGLVFSRTDIDPWLSHHVLFSTSFSESPIQVDHTISQASVFNSVFSIICWYGLLFDNSMFSHSHNLIGLCSVK